MDDFQELFFDFISWEILEQIQIRQLVWIIDKHAFFIPFCTDQIIHDCRSSMVVKQLVDVFCYSARFEQLVEVEIIYQFNVYLLANQFDEIYNTQVMLWKNFFEIHWNYLVGVESKIFQNRLQSFLFAKNVCTGMFYLRNDDCVLNFTTVFIVIDLRLIN